MFFSPKWTEKITLKKNNRPISIVFQGLIGPQGPIGPPGEKVSKEGAHSAPSVLLPQLCSAALITFS